MAVAADALAHAFITAFAGMVFVILRVRLCRVGLFHAVAVTMRGGLGFFHFCSIVIHHRMGHGWKARRNDKCQNHEHANDVFHNHFLSYLHKLASI